MPLLSKDEIKVRLPLEKVVENDLGTPEKRYSNWLHYFCPFHKNTHTPALGINLRTDTFKCFSCGKQGDIFTWHILRNNVDFKASLTYYRTQFPLLEQVSLSTQYQKKSLQVSWNKPPSQIWQAQGNTFLERSQICLWSKKGVHGRKELEHRGIERATAQAWGLGYNPVWIKQSGEKWGLDKEQTVWLPKGLVIPAFMDADLWYLKIRIFGRQGMPVKKVKGKSKYLQVLGSRPVLFGKNHFSGQENLLLAESELDVILAWQEGRHIFDLASLGGAGKHLSTQWMVHLLSYRKIILAYDADIAGRKGAENLKLLSKRLQVFTPPAEDLCAFYQEGGDLKKWLQDLLA